MNKDILIAKKTVQTEINALKKLSASFGRSSQFSKAVNIINKTRGKVLVIGVGKSYIIQSSINFLEGKGRELNFLHLLQHKVHYYLVINRYLLGDRQYQ